MLQLFFVYVSMISYVRLWCPYLFCPYLFIYPSFCVSRELSFYCGFSWVFLHILFMSTQLSPLTLSSLNEFIYTLYYKSILSILRRSGYEI